MPKVVSRRQTMIVMVYVHMRQRSDVGREVGSGMKTGNMSSI